MIANGGVSKETYAGAFEVLTGRPAEFRPRTGGSTDLLIMRDLAERHGAVLTEGPENIFGALESRCSFGGRISLLGGAHSQVYGRRWTPWLRWMERSSRS